MVNIIFKKLYLHNFLSFGDASLELGTSGYILITGINQNPTDSAKSNGSGKSAIWDALSWVLTGNTIRGTKDVVNKNGQDGTYVGIEFLLNNKEYKLLRSRDHKDFKSNLKIFIDGADKSGKGLRESEQLLLEYLPDVTPQLIGSVIIFGQGLPMRFSNNTPSGRKEVLEKLSKSDFMIEDLKERLTSRKDILTKELRECQDNRLSYESKTTVLNEQLKKCEKDISELTDINDLIAEIARWEGVVLEDQSNIISYKETANNINIQLQSQKDLSLQLTKNCSEEVEKATEMNCLLKRQLNEVALKYSSMCLSLTSEIKKLENIKDVCPTCGQKLPDVHKPDTGDKKLELEQATKDLQVVKKQLVDIENQDNEKKQQIKNTYNIQLKDINDKCNDLTLELKETNNKILLSEKHLKEIQSFLTIKNNEKNQYESKKQFLVNTILTNKEKLVEFGDKILYYKEKEEICSQHLTVIEKFNTAIKRDFRGFILKNVIEYIEGKAKQYSKQIFDTDKIGFFLDGNNIDITYDEKEYTCLSTGERQKVDIIVQFALRDMLCKYLSFDSNILVLDELFDGLDSIGCNKVIDLISTMNNISTIYIVTHRADLSIPIDKEMIVTKSSDGISSVA